MQAALRQPPSAIAACLCSVVSCSTLSGAVACKGSLLTGNDSGWCHITCGRGTTNRFNCTETEKQSMPAYLVYVCQGVSDRKELETYWKDMPPTFMGFDVKLHTMYR